MSHGFTRGQQEAYHQMDAEVRSLWSKFIAEERDLQMAAHALSFLGVNALLTVYGPKHVKDMLHQQVDALVTAREQGGGLEH